MREWAIFAYLRQNVGVKRISAVNISIRPRNIATVQIHVWKSVRLA
jgi:hypothetical protein